MKHIAGLIILAAVLITSTGFAGESKIIGKYMACDNHAGAGFFWVDTTMGKIWWTEQGKEKIEWKYIGQVQGAKAGEAGTCVPQANKNGGGLLILSTVTGEGWWTNGKEWKVLGRPE